MSVDEVVERLLNDPVLAANIVSYRVIPSRDADFRDFPPETDGRLLAALAARGISALYRHQREVIEAVNAGQHVVISTPTASGKSLCYNLPVLDAILKDDTARALYLFPTKALSQDQVAELHALAEAAGAAIKTDTYDGDTPQSARSALKKAGHIVVTNPDMLHTGILPHHTRWIRLFENLKYVVIDELHVYRGVFGSHVANVIRRLKRVCQFYGSNPQFIVCSATIANPRELAETVVEEKVCLIDSNGAPNGPKHVILYNPPVVNPQLGLRASSRLAACEIAGRLVNGGIQTILFSRSRTGVEILLGYLRDATGPKRRDTVRGYRGGYLPNQRREIERGLRDGTVRAVVTTNALELGIDIGHLEGCVVTGFPGTIASTWQQMGRAGRRSGSALAVLVANSNPLDQFLMSHPDYVFESSPESGLADPNNLIILVNHVKCAAFELPFRDGERYGVDGTAEILAYLQENDILHHDGAMWHWMSESFPAQDISLRSATTDNVVIIEEGLSARVIGEIDRRSAPTMVHEEAIYIHEGQQYQVEVLDLEEKKAFVRAVDVDYYTDAEQAVRIGVIDVFEEEGARAHGEVSVTYLPSIYKKIKLHTHENVGWGNIHLPEDTFHTGAYWVSVPKETVDAMPRSRMETALVGLRHVLGQVAPLYLMCDPADVAVWSEIKAVHNGLPTVFLYDRIPGGVGFSRHLYRQHQRILTDCALLVARCPCERGCPACIGPDHSGVNGAKLAVVGLADTLLRQIELPYISDLSV